MDAEIIECAATGAGKVRVIFAGSGFVKDLDPAVATELGNRLRLAARTARKAVNRGKIIVENNPRPAR